VDSLLIISRPIYHIPLGDKTVESRAAKNKCSIEDLTDGWLTHASGLTYKVTPRMFLEYNAMCALCHMALGQYQQAILFLEVILIAPTGSGATSQIAVDAYKRWILLNLITAGKVPEYPKPVYQATSRNVRSLAKPYECIMEAFKSRDPSRLLAEMHEGGDVWQVDATLGLIQDVYQAHRRYNVLHLGKTFAAIPVSQVISMLGTDQDGETPVQEYLQNLIASGGLSATLTPTSDGSDQILRFLPETVSKKSEVQMEQELNNRAIQLEGLLKRIGEVEHRMHLTKEYVDNLKKLKKTRDEDDQMQANVDKTKADVAAGKKPPTAYDIDEDMMGDEF
jgi:COP9 signalosome complex subunit 3